ncbi:riboflavin synthase [Patescibacteria group bacterium]
MFTGIITASQPIQAIAEKDGNKTFSIQKPADWKLETGESISIDGVCTTVISVEDDIFKIECMPETLRLTTLNKKEPGDKLNLERSVRADELLSGHLVYGHVDAVGTITEITEDGDSHIITIKHDEKFAKYIIQKGSVSLNGISLTVINPTDDTFSVSIVTYTWEETNLNAAVVGDSVNLEYDVIAKYLEKLHHHE